MEKIRVSLTSWPPRICNLPTCLTSIVNQTMRPDSVELNLSLEEFPKGFEDERLCELKKSIDSLNSLKINVNFVERNTGVFKKIIPTLKKYFDEDYYLISIDDDVKYDPFFIQTLYDGIVKYDSDSFCIDHGDIIGNCTIYKSKVFGSDLWELLTDEIIANRIDDAYIRSYLKWKNANIKSEYHKNLKTCFNPVCPNSHDSIHGQYPREDVIKAEIAIAKIFSKNEK